MKRKLFCPILFGLLSLLMIICVPVRAEPVASGTFGRSNLEMQWSVEGNTLYITGNGYMDGFSRKESRPWDSYLGQIQRIVMTGTIDNIGSYAFEGCTELTEIVWPDGIETIYNNAFEGCTSLKNVTIPKTVERIREYAFDSCTALEVVTMSENVTYIGDAVFDDCSALHTVKLSSKLQEIGRWCFMGCTALQQIDLPSSLQTLGAGAFQLSGLVKITIPEKVQDIAAFAECRELEEVTFAGKRINILGSGTFRDCVSLTTVNMPAEVSSVHMDAFTGCKKLTGINFYGDMPKFQPSVIFVIKLIVYYPEENATWTQEAMDAFYKENIGDGVQFVPTVYQVPEETVPGPTVQTPPVPDEPQDQTNDPTVGEPTEQSPAITEPPATNSAEETQPPKTENAENPTTVPAENTATEPVDGKEEATAFPWGAVCIGAAVLLAVIGVIVWFRVKKVGGPSAG